jgi:PqqA peptide cyclase
VAGLSETPAGTTPTIAPPLWLLAELTYRCPLHCVFCSNPVDYASKGAELSTEEWLRVLREARELGAVQLGLSGGEPLARDDLEDIAKEARRLGYYSNLITSGVGMTAERAKRLKDCGLDHVQLSFQDSTREMNDFLSHTKTFDLKRKVAGIIKDNGWPMVMNVVLHRHNLAHVGRIIELALELEADFLELANTQYYGWAWLNRDQLLPTREQLREAEAEVQRWRERIERGGKRCKILFVVPDYFEERPKACMNGWGSVFLAVSPQGVAMPCHAAASLPGLQLPSIKEHSVRDIWYESSAFNQYRGQAWMQEPCRSCPEKDKDFGGCRCQAYQLAGNPAATDPVCSKSPQHEHLVKLVQRKSSPTATQEFPLVFRQDAQSRSTDVARQLEQVERLI